jgi:hypothetical protein
MPRPKSNEKSLHLSFRASITSVTAKSQILQIEIGL